MLYKSRGKITKTIQTPEQAEEQTPGIDRKLVWILAVACALSVANLYYIQPLLADMARTFAVSDSAVGTIATVTQLGYALGLLLIVPLGDFFNRRNLIVFSLLGVALALLATAFAPTILFLGVASFVVGITTVVPQVIVPFAATLAHPGERGRVVGTIMSGLLIGVLLARTVSGFVAAAFGWRTMYWIAAILMVALALALWRVLPREQRRPHVSYPALLLSLWDILRTEPVVREVSAFGGLMFGAFSVFWVTLVFFIGTPPYHYGSAVAGLFGLVGIVGAVAASTVGTLSDRMNPRIITGFMLVAVLLAFLAFWLTGYWLWGLIVGVILLDLGTQGTHISNQTRIYALNPAARSRLNTVYTI